MDTHLVSLLSDATGITIKIFKMPIEDMIFNCDTSWPTALLVRGKPDRFLAIGQQVLSSHVPDVLRPPAMPKSRLVDRSLRQTSALSQVRIVIHRVPSPRLYDARGE